LRKLPYDEPGTMHARDMADASEWSVTELTCTCGPRDVPFEETHGQVSVALVLGRTFTYQGPHGKELMTPGSLLLGSPRQNFVCSHEHGTGDLCLAFFFRPGYLAEMGESLGVSLSDRPFGISRVPPVRELSPCFALAASALRRGADVSWEEMSLRLLARTLSVTREVNPLPAPSRAIACDVAQTARLIATHPERSHSVAELARECNLSPFYFLRAFRQVCGCTPHQYLLRARLRTAAQRLLEVSAPVGDIALEAGFQDLANFNRMFRQEFEASPREFRRRGHGSLV